MKILTIVGARPQFVKAAVVSREIRKHPSLTEVIVHTGQHFDANMSEVFFEQMDIPRPDYNLAISGLSHGAMTGRMLEGIDEILQQEKPSVVLVYGDTNSTLAGALAASKLNIPVAHVEAGLRSFNMAMPEEINRILTDRVSQFLFCPTDTAVSNLLAEGMSPEKVSLSNCGDVMQDAALYYSTYESMPLGLDRESLEGGFVLSTVHRAESTDDDDRLREIIDGINAIAKDQLVIFPLHPRTKQRLSALKLNVDALTIDPVGYLEMLYLLKRCSIVVTDSGGLQKEAFFFQKPCVTMRQETEWVELLDLGVNILAGGGGPDIYESYLAMKNKVVSDDNCIYGGGRAAEAIIRELLLKL